VLQDQDIICIAPEAWNVSWLDVHRYMHILASDNRILYVERPISIVSFLVPGQRELFLPQLKQWLSSSVREVEPNLYVGTPPPGLPMRFETTILLFNQFIRRTWVKSVSKRLGFKNPILWIYDSDAEPLVGSLGEKISLYTITDDYANNPFYHNRKKQIHKWDTLLMKKVDLLLASASNLADAKRDVNPNVYYTPHGVESELFAQALDSDLSIPEEIANIPAPIVGYMGRVDEPIDVSIIEAMVKTYPDWNFVFVGPVPKNKTTDSLKALDRTHFVGLKPVSELPYYMKGMSVCIIPYKFGLRTQYTHPLKALEYLASGRPVVSTPMPALQVHKDYIYFAKEPDAFARAVEQALKEDNPQKRLARSQYTQDKTWRHQVDNISLLIQQILEQKLAKSS